MNSRTRNCFRNSECCLNVLKSKNIHFENFLMFLNASNWFENVFKCNNQLFKDVDQSFNQFSRILTGNYSQVLGFASKFECFWLLHRGFDCSEDIFHEF
jgi:hypothetical protein